MWYSIDQGFSWAKAEIPNGIGPILSVALYMIDGITYWVYGCSNGVFYSTGLLDTDWQEILLPAKDVVIDMQVSSNLSTLVLVGNNGVYWTYNGAEIFSWSHDGYVFDGLHKQAVNGQDVFFFWARSTLTQYTYWYTQDFVNWTAASNSIHVQSSVSTI